MPTSQDKVLQFHINRLKDRSRDVVLRTIEELIKFGASAESALPALEQLFRTTEDPVIKKAAQVAGLEIHKKVKEAKQQEA
ncbi:MAG: hypothetical protein CUN55_09385 [Phototrophicales bacterium]|nr:MAG: hypothetical protein CUN55_09385 [Phototrophicales bacterium]